MQNKFKMSQEENIFYAKRNIVDSIWKSANLEGIGVTYPETDAIFNGKNIDRLGVKEIVKINNLKYAWQFILDNIDYPMDYAYLCKINQMVGQGDIYKAGYIRNADVSIGGTTWRPEIPNEESIKENLEKLQEIENATERAIKTMLYCIRGQFYFDGNKRTSMLAANQILISNGAGILSVPIDKQNEFYDKLIKFYETGEGSDLTAFLYDKCLDGMVVRKEVRPLIEIEPLRIYGETTEGYIVKPQNGESSDPIRIEIPKNECKIRTEGESERFVVATTEIYANRVNLYKNNPTAYEKVFPVKERR